MLLLFYWLGVSELRHLWKLIIFWVKLFIKKAGGLKYDGVSPVGVNPVGVSPVGVMLFPKEYATQ